MGEVEELSEREQLVLGYIASYMADPKNILHQPPSHAELMSYLNKHLKKKIVSTQQTHRIALSLRNKGLLVNVELKGHRNMVLTDTGKKIAKAVNREGVSIPK